ncbi:cysteine-rich receptor-like protein kinase, partial [Trifolium medium]|nr:cysteine-rich receptor-like protein kinase [Trifolium medium]
VLAARYGVERDHLRDGGRSESSWWREVAKIRDGTGGLGGGWFGEYVVKQVGDGLDTFLWTDPWLGGTPLCVRFRRLFDLAENKSSTVVEMTSLGWEAGGEAWASSLDLWQWQPDPIKGYSVQGAYQLLTSQQSVSLDAAADLIWHKHVPLKCRVSSTLISLLQHI